VAKTISKETISTLSEKDLMSLSLSSFKLSLKDSELFLSCKKQLQKELQNLGIKHTPHFWVSDDWFSPDGVFGVALPFYLFHPRLSRLEKKEIGQSEGSSRKEMMKLLRHECGHAFDNAYHLRKKKKRQILFGLSTVPYPKSYSPNINSKNYVTHLSDFYAQSHPDEDWAETFAVWLGEKKGWRKKYQGTKALEKLNYVDDVFSHNHKLICKNKTVVDPLKSLNVTLEEYFLRKKKRLKLGKNSPLYSLSKEIGSFKKVKQESPALFSLRNQSHLELCLKLAKNTGIPENRVMYFLDVFKKLCKEQKLDHMNNLCVDELSQILKHKNAYALITRVFTLTLQKFAKLSKILSLILSLIS